MDAMPEGLDSQEWVPAACTLPITERPLRRAEFDDLFSTALRSVDRPADTRARLLLAGDAALAERTQRLADAESACCSFVAFGVRRVTPGLVTLEIEVPPAYADVLAALVARAEQALGEAS